MIGEEEKETVGLQSSRSTREKQRQKYEAGSCFMENGKIFGYEAEIWKNYINQIHSTPKKIRRQKSGTKKEIQKE